MNYAISAHNPPQMRESVRLIDSQDSNTNVCVLSADSPGNRFNGGGGGGGGGAECQGMCGS